MRSQFVYLIVLPGRDGGFPIPAMQFLAALDPQLLGNGIGVLLLSSVGRFLVNHFSGIVSDSRRDLSHFG